MRRALRLALYAVALLPLGGFVLMAAAAYRAFARIKSADPSWEPSFRVLAWARAWALLYRVPWDFALSILHNENASTLRAPRAGELRFFDSVPEQIYPLGDVNLPLKGPSVGPGQVLRINVERLWERATLPLRPAVVAGSYSDLALPGYERASSWAAVQIMRESIDAAGGDLNEAARIYNGGPHYNSDAVAYADKADAFRAGLSS